MNVRHLRHFLTVASCGSFSTAAQKVYISPNALIEQMNRLEERVGVKLFVRTNHGVRITEAGKSFAKDVKRIMALTEEAIQRARDIEKTQISTVRLGTSLLRPSRTIVELWSTVSANHPDIRLQIVPFDDTYDQWIRLLEDLGKEIDVVVGIYPSSLWNRRCQVLKLSDIPLCCAVPRSHKLASKDRLTFEDFKGEKILMVERGDTSYIDALRDDIITNHPEIFIVDVPSYDTSIFNICERVNHPMITIGTWAEVHPSLVTIPCEWSYTVPYGLIYPCAPSPAVTRFVDILSNFAR